MNGTAIYKYAYSLGLAALVLILDQISKYFVLLHLNLFQPIEITPFFNLTLAYNTGAAFSFLNQAGGWQQWLFGIVAVFVCGVILCWIHRLPIQRLGRITALSLILGGAIGNLVDRIYYGYVVDFIDLHINQYHWPVFNIADTAITVGAIVLIILLWLQPSDT